MKFGISSIGLLVAFPLMACGPAVSESGEQESVALTHELLESERTERAVSPPAAARLLEKARVDFNAYAKNASEGGEWAELRSAKLDPVSGTSLKDIVAKLYGNQQGVPTFSEGTLFTRLDANGWSFFGTHYSIKGPDLAGVARKIGGAKVQGWRGTSGTDDCHNCTESLDRVVLFFPDTGRVIAFEGVYGWDS